MSTRVVHCKRAPYDVYIGRPSKWGNSFRIGRDGTREQVIGKYRAWIQTQPRLLAALPELRGKTLGCWCKPLPCHGDVLAELADASSESTPRCCVLVCGSRDWRDPAPIHKSLVELQAEWKSFEVVDDGTSLKRCTLRVQRIAVVPSGARGADTFARQIAGELGLPVRDDGVTLTRRL